MRDAFDKDAKFEVLEHYGILSSNARGWTLEFNKVKWGERAPVYEIRRWGPDRSIVGKGFTLYPNELPMLADILEKYLSTD